MPLYDFKCSECESIEEKLVKLEDVGEQYCEKCGNKLEKCLPLSNFALKGSGWYKDGYSSKPTSKESE